MEMLASDIANPNFVGASDPDRALHVTFYQSALQNAFQSEIQGRPIYDQVDMIRIIAPGDKNSIIDTIARADHKARFPRQWQAYKDRTDTAQIQSGTPIEQWTALTAAQAQEFKGMKFLTVEAVAGAGDAQLSGIGMIAGQSVFKLRDQAKAFLQLADVAAKNAEADRRIADAKAEAEAQMQKMRGEATEEIARIKAENETTIAQMRLQMEQMMQQQLQAAIQQMKGAAQAEPPKAQQELQKAAPEAQKRTGPAKATEFIPA